MPHAVGDIVEVTWEQDVYSQVLLNIQHYRVQSSSSSSSDVADNQSLADHLAGLTGAMQLISVWRSITTPAWTLRRVRAQKIDPVRSAYVTSDINQPGGELSGESVQNLAAVVSKRGTDGTRKAQGSVHFGGISATLVNQGLWQAPIDAWWDVFEPLYTAFQTPAANNVIYQPVIYNPNFVPNYQTIAVWQLQNQVRVMRRRTVGQGI